MTFMQLSAHRARLHARAPFDFRHTLSFACGFTPMADEQDAGDGRYIKAMVVAGQPVVVQLASAHDGDDPGALSSAAAARRAGNRWQLTIRSPGNPGSAASFPARIEAACCLR
jgi:hypothetical protein